MTDPRRTQLEEDFLDASLSLLLDEYAENQGAKWLEVCQSSGVSMPETLDKACVKLIQKTQSLSQKEFLLRRTASRAAKAAVIGICCLLLCGNLIMSVEALRVPFLNFCIDTHRAFSSLTFPDENETGSDETIASLPITFPPGFELSVSDHNYDDALIREDSTLFLACQDDGGHTLMIQTLPAQGSLSIDTENAEATRFLLDGMQAIHIRQEADHTLRTIWIDPERQRLFDVSCNGLPQEEFEQYIYELAAMFQSPTLYAE